MQEAKLTGANLSKANLCEANLTSTNLQEANLSEANLTKANLQFAKYDSLTQWPYGFEPKAAGAIEVQWDNQSQKWIAAL